MPSPKTQKLKLLLSDSNIKEEEKIKFFLQKDGKVSASVLRWLGSDLKSFPIYEWVFQNTKELDQISKEIPFGMRLSYLTDNEHNRIEKCKTCGKPFIVFTKLQTAFRSCKHKQRTIDVKPLIRKRIDSINEEFSKSLDNNGLFLSEEEFSSFFIKEKEKMVKNDNARLLVCKLNFSFLHDLVVRTKNIVQIDKENLRLMERFYLLDNNLQEIPKCRICNETEMEFINRYVGYKDTCKKCYKDRFQEIWSEKNKQEIDNKLDKNKYEILSYPKVVTKDPIKILCKKCGKTSEVWIHNGVLKHLDSEHLCKHCESNSEEDEVFDFISSIYNGTVIHGQKSRIIIPPKELDIYIPDKKLAIEFNGIYWHSEFAGTDKTYHLKKTEECEKKEIQLIHLFEDDWLYRKDIVKSRLKNLLGIYDNKCFARQCEVKEVSSLDSINFQSQNHIQGAINSKVNLGLYFKDELVSLMTFSKPRFDKKHDWELVRFCNKLGWHIPGAASKLLSHFEREYNPKNIVSYADRSWSKGNLYRQLGFELDHISSPNYFYISKKEMIRESRVKYQKHKLSKLLENFDPSKTESENMSANGYYRVWDCGNLVFVKNYTNKV